MQPRSRIPHPLSRQRPTRAPAVLVVLACALAAALAVPAAASAERYLVVFSARQGVPAGFAGDVAAIGGAVARTLPEVGLAVVSGLDPAGAAELAARPGIQALTLEPVHRLDELAASPEQPVAPAESAAAGPEGALFYPLQWHLPAIGADRAWAAGELGSAAVTVAVLDTGLDYTHPDLAGRVDLARSISLLPDQDALVQQHFPGRHPITDLHWHGTFAGALIASNGVLTAGVTRETTLLGVKVCDVTGDCREGEVLAGMVYAADAGADVLNLSIAGFGSAANPLSETPGLVAAVNRVFNYVHRRGAVVVVAAGNEAADLDHNGNAFHFWCQSPHTICVSATAPTAGGLFGPWPDPDTPATYTNFGHAAIDVAAPGGGGGPFNVYGFVISACTGTSLIPQVAQICSSFGFFGSGGTSFSAPHVSGLAALLASRHPGQPARIRAEILGSAVDLGDPGHDPFYGRGRIDVPAALGID